MKSEKPKPAWLEGLSDEDLAFVKRFLLASGSLKQVAGQYGISYPTVRLRLDRLIEKIKLYDSQAVASEFERLLRVLFAEGKIDMNLLSTILDAHEREIETASEENSE